MKRLWALGAVAVAILFTCDAVIAADLIVPRRERPAAKPQPARQTTASSNWSGGQIGGNGGGSVSNNNFVEPGAYLCSGNSRIGVSCFETPFSFVQRTWSAVGGAFAGYRIQMDNTVVGVEVDALWQNAKAGQDQTTLCVTGGPCGTGGASRRDGFWGRARQGWEASFRGRYGILVTPTTLLYATAGVSFGEFSGSFRYVGTQTFGNSVNTADAAGSWRDVRVGGTIGVGAETQLAPGVKIRGEYRFTHYGSYSKDFPVTTVCVLTCGSISNNARVDINDVYNHKFLAGIGFDL